MHDDSARHQIGGNKPAGPYRRHHQIATAVDTAGAQVSRRPRPVDDLREDGPRRARGLQDRWSLVHHATKLRRPSSPRGIRCSSSAKAASRVKPAIAAKVAKARPAKRRLTTGKGKASRDERAVRP